MNSPFKIASSEISGKAARARLSLSEKSSEGKSRDAKKTENIITSFHLTTKLLKVKPVP